MFSKTFKILVGAGVSILALIGIFAIIYFLAVDSGRRTQGGLTVNQPNQEKERHAMSVYFSTPERIWRSTYSLSKVFLQDPDVEARFKGMGSFSSSSYQQEGTLVNLLFLNTQTSDSRLLFSEPVFIEALDFPSTRDDSGQTEILLDVIAHDSNKDGFINGKDNSVLYFTDLTGAGLTKITADSTSVINRHFLDHHTKLVMTLRFPSHDTKLEERFWPRKLYWYDFAKRGLYSYPRLDTLLEQSMNILRK